MSEQDKKDGTEDPKKESVIEGEAVTVEASDEQTVKKESHINADLLTRIFVTLLFALIGWLALWVFGFVVLVQFGFLLITGNLNKNLKAFNGELGNYLSDIIKYVAFQTEEKPFPFQGWHYDDKKSDPGPDNGEATNHS
ncbi:DUF4389 domain-containing protein [Marinicella meishanensis]|uniref:DUF4389 domain-containing protein n=1 Tax=Marinicella meishanensis TaxID=2873263 RepID=UPI001CBB005C|nr:DUF4389 domain-containing protein [Marinicella sp. NBU2979]